MGNGLDFRSAARSAAGSEWMGYRMWSETEGEVRLEVPEHRGLSGGVEMAWRHRIDAVRGTYDEDRALVGAWISGANRAWSGKARCTWNAVHSAGQTVYSEQGWDTYRYNHVVCEGRLERTIRGDVGLSPLVDCSCGGRTPCLSDGTSDQIGRLAGSVAVLFGRRQRLLAGSDVTP